MQVGSKCFSQKSGFQAQLFFGTACKWRALILALRACPAEAGIVAEMVHAVKED